jgi:hypothetical protein
MIRLRHDAAAQGIVGSKVPMQTRSKIRLDAIERIKKTLETLPQHHAEELTKKQAIRMLLPNIETIRAKGYGLPAIAGFLSEHGIPITVAYLKTMLSPSRQDAEGAKSSKRKKRPTHRGGNPERNTARDPRKGEPEAKVDEVKVATVTRAAAPEKAATVSGADAVGARRDARAVAPVTPPGRAMFVPREDSEEI